jgi:hypothetical protein
MQTVCPASSVQENPAAHEPGTPSEHVSRQTPLMHLSPVRQMASGPLGAQRSLGPAISAGVQAQMPEAPWVRQAGHVPGLVGLQLDLHRPPTHGVPAAHGEAVLQAWHEPPPIEGKHNDSLPPSKGRHAAGLPLTGAQVVAVQPVHSGDAPLQHSRQKEMFGSLPSTMHALHAWQKPETSQRSPSAPVGVQVPPWHA